MTGIERAIERAGGELALGGLLGVSQQYINKMKQRGYCPPVRAKQIAELYPDIPRSDLLDPVVVEVLNKR